VFHHVDFVLLLERVAHLAAGVQFVEQVADVVHRAAVEVAEGAHGLFQVIQSAVIVLLGGLDQFHGYTHSHTRKRLGGLLGDRLLQQNKFEAQILYQLLLAQFGQSDHSKLYALQDHFGDKTV